jgi:hypothetical protein
MRKKRIFVMSIKRDIEFCDQHHIHAKHSIKDHAADCGQHRQAAGAVRPFLKKSHWLEAAGRSGREGLPRCDPRHIEVALAMVGEVLGATGLCSSMRGAVHERRDFQP